MARHIRYPAECFYCRSMTKPGHGFLQRVGGSWFAHCYKCYEEKKENRAITRKHEGVEEMGKLEIAVLIGAESKDFLADLTKQIDRLEKLSTAATSTVTGKKTATTATETEAEETTTISAKSVAAKAKANGKKAAAPAADEEDFDLGQEEDATDEVPAVTKKDLIAACRDNREAAIKVLKKMKVNSVHELKPTQYAAVLSQIGAN